MELDTKNGMCQARNMNDISLAAQALGRRSKGKPKTLSVSERARRRAAMDEINARKKCKAERESDLPEVPVFQ